VDPRVSIHGRVVDTAQAPLAGAKVRLERDHAAAQEATSGADGSFEFIDLEVGTYTVVAEKDGVSGHAAQAVTSESDARQPITLVLETQHAAGGATGTPAMEFADTPNFTIAGVTDWTAAGGHGSDVSLRTSEALNRETLTLKPTKGAGEAGEHAEEDRLSRALAAAPESFDANRQLGQLYLSEGHYREAVPLLQKAYDLNPADAENESELAIALKEVGNISQARRHVEHAMGHADNADVHRVAGTIYEASGDPLQAVHEFALAVQMVPSEQNYFAWGEELLQHRAVLQAKEVFAQGVRRYPKSSRLLTSLGAALFAGALYQQAAERLCEASDLDPNDLEPYRFMGQIEVVAPHFDSCMSARLARYAEVHPKDALADYFYAMDLWKQQGNALDAAMQRKVEALLTQAVTIDPKCGAAFLQLGNLRSSERNYPVAIELYGKAIAADPQSSEAHYRLGVAYDRMGKREKAKQEFAAHDAINQQQAAETERQRKEVKQFVMEAEKTPSAAPGP
jgi:tetratricopeptide (TPR) repeat protein